MASDPDGWIVEIAKAYYDAYEAIPFGTFVDQSITESELFHMAPHICLKLRGIKPTPSRIKKASDAMLTSYFATKEQDENIFDNPHVAFSFAYLASHFGMNLISEKQVAEIMDYIERNKEVLAKAIKRKCG